jgi:hypothetical protein
MIVPTDTPSITERFKDVSTPVAIGVSKAGHFRPLRSVKPAVFVRETERFVDAFGKELILHFARISIIGTREGVDISTARGHGDLLIRKDFDPTDLEHDSVWNGQRGDWVVVGFFGGFRQG